MRADGVAIDAVTYNILFMLYIRSQQMEKVEELMAEMKAQGYAGAQTLRALWGSITYDSPDCADCTGTLSPRWTPGPQGCICHLTVRRRVRQATA